MTNRRISGIWASGDGRNALELFMDGRFEECWEGQLTFAGHYEMEGESLRLYEDGGGQLVGRLTEGRLSLGPVPSRREIVRPRRGPSIEGPRPLY